MNRQRWTEKTVFAPALLMADTAAADHKNCSTKHFRRFRFEFVKCDRLHRLEPVRQIEQRVYGLAMWMLRQEQDAKEVTQQTFFYFTTTNEN